jgi:hypothetical protein
MNKQNVRILTALVGAVLLVTGMAQAQYAPHYLKVSVPFEFNFGDKTFPSGDYVVACTPIRAELRDAQGQVLASVVHHAVQSPSSRELPKLVFTTDGGSHVLRQVWVGDPHNGYELAPSKSAVALAKQHSHAPVSSSGGGNK